MSANEASGQPCDATPNSAGVFDGLKVAVVPFPALGDITIYLRLCWLFCRSGAHVTFYSHAFYSAREYFPWLTIVPEHDDELDVLADRFELVIACFEKYYFRRKWSPLYAALNNVAFVTAKKISRDSGLDGRGVVIRGKDFFGASRAFCLDSDAGKSMVEWVDSYAKEVFAIETHPMPGLFGLQLDNNAGLVLIFPTTPQPKKNYWLAGFRWLANSLQKKGWRVEFVCMPGEREQILKAVPGFQVRSFPDIKGLIDHVASASIVISNDSGGGHLGSLMGLATFTITRRHQCFAWRPGFNQRNTVVCPWFRFKWSGDYIWRPFVPVRLIVKKIGSPSGGV